MSYRVEPKGTWPAFPQEQGCQTMGMSFRDYVAAHCLAALAGSPTYASAHSAHQSPQLLAAQAVALAECLIEQLGVP